MRVDDDAVQSAAGALACVDVNWTKVGDNFDEEFVGEREGVTVWKGNRGVLYYVRIINASTVRSGKN
jgi:hypothetical protein